MLPLLLAALQGVTLTVTRPPVADTLLPVADSVAMATAYRDEATRELVRLARAHRGVIDASVFRYTATARQRVSLGVRALRRDRLIYRRETASLVDWRRDGPSRVEVVGAREAVPIAMTGVRVPGDLEDWARSFVPRPGDDRLFVNPGGGGFAWHPLVEGGEALYRYETGDTTVIRLPDGGAVRLVELRVTPRERDIRVVTGSFWIELDNHAIVQAVFRPSREFDMERDLARMSPEDAGDVDDVPGIFKPVRFDIRYVTVEYGLWEMRWWMPRLMAFDGSLQLGALRFPINMELTYADYVVEPDRHGLPELPPLTLHLAGYPHARPLAHRYPTRVVIADTARLLASPLLPASVYAEGERLISEGELRELADRLGALPAVPWEVGRPSVSWPWEPGSGLLRYNRVEGLSAGARLDWDLTRAHLDLTGRIGTGDRVPYVELGATVPTLRRSWRVAAYHRLAAADPAARPFGLQNSLSALLLGQDQGLYFRGSGVEMRVEPAGGETRYRARVYGERQAAVARNTDFSVRRLLGGDHEFRPNIDADGADQVGASLWLGRDRGLDPAGVRWGGWLDLTAETGTFSFVRPGVTLRGGVPLPGRLLAAAELGAGTTLGAAGETGFAAPVQSHWFLGGPTTLRGFAPGTFSGPDHLRGRAELATRLPAARLVVFSDAGWAGSFDHYHGRDVAVSAGAGASLLDGLLRFDVARALRPITQWRLEMYVDALF
jgi:hypothetical protein